MTKINQLFPQFSLQILNQKYHRNNVSGSDTDTFLVRSVLRSTVDSEERVAHTDMQTQAAGTTVLREHYIEIKDHFFCYLYCFFLNLMQNLGRICGIDVAESLIMS